MADPSPTSHLDPAAPALTGPVTAPTRRAIRREVFRLAWPAILEMCLHMGVWMCDVAMVGRLGATALSATALSGQIFWGTMMLLWGLGIGVTSIVSRRVGEGNLREAARTGAQGLFVGLLAGLVGGAIIWVLAPSLFALTGLGPEVVATGTTYLRILTRAAPFLVLSTVMGGILRAHGDTRTPMLVVALVNTINVVGDYALIFGHFGLPALGVRGAAIASLTAQVIGAVVLAALLFGGALRVRLTVAAVFRPDWLIIVRILRLSIPASLESMFVDLARTVSVFAVASLGAVAVASHEVTCTTESLSFMPGYGFAIAATILVGQNLGAGQPERARATVAEAARIALWFMGSVGVLFLFFPRPLVSIFTNDPAIIDLAATCLRVSAFAQATMALHGVYSGALRGAGDTRTPMLISGITSWGFRVALTFVAIFVFDLGLPWVWGIMALDYALKLAWVAAAYRRGRWLRVTV